MLSFSLPSLDFSLGRSIVVACAVLAIASLDLVRRMEKQPTQLLFATVFGTALSVALIQISSGFLKPGATHSSFALAALVVLVFFGWKALFGPWGEQNKATMLGTFLFWMTLHLLWTEDPRQRSIHLIAAGTALIPAAIWCMLFLKYHTERISRVLLLFFSGMLATVPILFYDALVHKGVELQFFLFRIQPENFSQAAQTFVSGHVRSAAGLRVVILSSLLSFLIVGIIEEVSKYWALTHSAKALFSSIDDVLQLSIIVAIGFSFAENIINPVYFTAFVNEYLFHAAAPDVGGFLSNVLGRSVLTTMVHVVSTGVMGYFFGLAIFAGPYLAEQRAEGHMYRILAAVHRVFHLQETSVFRVQMLLTGLVCATLLHTFFNFLVTVPDLLPGNPRTIGDVAGNPLPVIFKNIPLLLLPAMFYVVGGFWLLTNLFLRKENLRERGHLVIREMLAD